MMETNTNLIAHGVWASNKNTVIQDENSLRLASSQPFFLKSDVAAVSVDIHGRAGSSWHLIQDFTNIACDLNSTFFIHQNKGMFLQKKIEQKKASNIYIRALTQPFSVSIQHRTTSSQPHTASVYHRRGTDRMNTLDVTYWVTIWRLHHGSESQNLPAYRKYSLRKKMEFLVPQHAVTPYESQELQESQSCLLGHQRKTSLHILHW